MGPQITPTHRIDRTSEYEEFINTLRAYHLKRGTNFEPEPKVGNVHVDLLQLFKLVKERGGYDKVSDEKLVWRAVVNNLGAFATNEAAAAYSLKTAYYKNLAAYEISTVFGKEPPPPEILEHISAKGGGLLNRTMENFAHKVGLPLGADPSDRSGDDATPTRERERRNDDTPGTGRASGRLREAPPQRVIFQPPTGPTRQTRHSSGQHAHSNAATPTSHASSHAPAAHPHQHSHLHGGSQHMPPQQQQQHRGPSESFNPQGADNFSATIQSYEFRKPIPIALHPVMTPGNSPVEFARRQRLLQKPANGPAPGRLPHIAAFDGPNIYSRCLSALRSEIPGEERFALCHLVKISFERGDKYKYDSFQGLAEGLVEKAIQVGKHFYDVDWTISYTGEVSNDIGELDGVNGTADILERISQLKPKPQNGVRTAEFSDQIIMITEATLVIRNMVTLFENAEFLADFPSCSDLVCIILNLPNDEAVVELKHYALEIAEHLTPNLVLADDDPLYRSLLNQLDSPDRGAILTALRALGRISMNLAETNRLGGVPSTVLESLMNWLLLNDDELMDACLDFLYQYTAVVPNVETLLMSVMPENLVSHLVRLLSHGAKRGVKEQILEAEKKIPATEHVVSVPRDLLERLVARDEPDRCYTWLKCFFEEDPDSSITQIAIWQAYQAAFAQKVQQAGRSMLGAADFIRNVTHVYHNAGAQIQREQGEKGEIQKFIIKGIRSRVIPVTEQGDEHFRCQWRVPSPSHPKQLCGGYFAEPRKMYYHVLHKHLGETSDEEGRITDKTSPWQCQWSGCRQYQEPAVMHLQTFMQHLKTHIVACQPKGPQNGVQSSEATQVGPNALLTKRQRKAYIIPAKTISLPYEETLTAPRDERNPNAAPQAAGIPLSAVLILRNLARNAVKTASEEELVKRAEMGGEPGGWNERLFRSMQPRLFEIMTENKTLAPYVASLLELIRRD